METFDIPVAMARAIVEHAQFEYPKECCGVIVGPPGEPRALHRMTNIDPDPVMRYTADPSELKRINDDNFERDWEILCIYHSHTHTPAFPSPTDVERAGYPDAVYALVSLQDRGDPDLRAFRILGGRIDELSVVEVAEEAI